MLRRIARKTGKAVWAAFVQYGQLVAASYGYVPDMPVADNGYSADLCRAVTGLTSDEEAMMIRISQMYVSP